MARPSQPKRRDRAGPASLVVVSALALVLSGCGDSTKYVVGGGGGSPTKGTVSGNPGGGNDGGQSVDSGVDAGGVDAGTLCDSGTLCGGIGSNCSPTSAQNGGCDIGLNCMFIATGYQCEAGLSSNDD